MAEVSLEAKLLTYILSLGETPTIVLTSTWHLGTLTITLQNYASSRNSYALEHRKNKPSHEIQSS